MKLYFHNIDFYFHMMYDKYAAALNYEEVQT